MAEKSKSRLSEQARKLLANGQSSKIPAPNQVQESIASLERVRLTSDERLRIRKLRAEIEVLNAELIDVVKEVCEVHGCDLSQGTKWTLENNSELVRVK